MKIIRRTALGAASLVLATAGAVVVSATPAQAAPACPATDSGFVYAASRDGASGAETGTLTGTTGGDYYVACHYSGRYWVAPTSGSLGYPGGNCTWTKEWYLIGGWSANRKNVRCP